MKKIIQWYWNSVPIYTFLRRLFISETIVAVDRAMNIYFNYYNKGEEMEVAEISKNLNLNETIICKNLATLEKKDPYNW